MHKIAVGIDLGTTYSAVAVFQNKRSETIINGLGNRLTPSCVAFTQSERIVGEGAVYKAANNPENTIYGVKRLMGRNFTDKAIEKDIKSWPFKVMEENNQIKIEVQYKNERKRYFPEEISAAILENLKNTAEVYLGVKIKDVVITCPAYFDNSQKEATMDAAKIAGLHVLRLINEPTAAAIAYGLHVKNSAQKTALIFDFGGGTFDVSILTIKGKDFSVRATNGDTHLGGEDFDMLMVNYFVTQFKRKHKQDISENKGLMSQLKSHCERAKRILSNAKEVDIQLEGTKLTGTISRALFEDLIEDLCERAIKLVGDALIKAKVTKNEIDDVVMVGGSSRIPLIQKKLSKFFDGKQLSHKLNPDEAVAQGAAIQAAMLQGQLNGLKLRDVCPLPLGTKVADGSVSVIIEGNSPIPAKASQSFVTARDMQRSASIEIYEGERTMAEDNHFLGEFVVDGIPPMARHKGEIENIYEIDENGILKVTAVTAGSSKSLTITNKSRLSKDDAKRLAKEAAQFRAEDAMHKARLEAYNAFDYYLYDITRKMSSLLSEAKQKKAKAFIDDYSKWMDENPKATKEEFEEKQFNLERKWNDVQNM